eukprot:COSAG01_NODE_319_length_18909_cov_32.636151_6_plen_117_part_00
MPAIHQPRRLNKLGFAQVLALVGATTLQFALVNNCLLRNCGLVELGGLRAQERRGHAGGSSAMAASKQPRGGALNGCTACLNDAPCPPLTSHGASIIRQPFGAGPSPPAGGVGALN